MISIKIFSDEEKFLKESLDFIIKAFRTKKGVVRIALSGGSTPKPLYQALGKRKLPFKKIALYQVDERYVPEENANSNQKMIKEALGTSTVKQLKGVHFFNTKVPLSESLNQYEKILGKIPQKEFDIIVLGIGSDGHIASLFPSSKVLKTRHLVAHTQTEIFPVKDRLTITLPIILKSRNILILLKGKDKKSIMETIINKKIALPVKALIQNKKAKIQLHYCE